MWEIVRFACGVAAVAFALWLIATKIDELRVGKNLSRLIALLVASAIYYESSFAHAAIAGVSTALSMLLPEVTSTALTAIATWGVPIAGILLGAVIVLQAWNQRKEEISAIASGDKWLLVATGATALGAALL